MNRPQERLEEILQEIEPGRDRELVSRAAAFVRRVHAGQERADGDTMYEHLLGTAECILEAGRNEGFLVAAALLHDVIEQTPLTLNDLERDFGTRVSSLVDAVTNRPGDDTTDSVARAEAEGEDAILLRICDRLDAVRRAHNRPEETRDEYIESIRQHHLFMARRHFPEFSAELDKAIRNAKNRSEE